jgi:hypothetical protein
MADSVPVCSPKSTYCWDVTFTNPTSEEKCLALTFEHQTRGEVPEVQMPLAALSYWSRRRLAITHVSFFTNHVPPSGDASCTP